MNWETVIGLEVHVQLATRSKLFSAANTAYGAQPNTQACAIDLAMPGTLPVANEEAFRFAVMFGLAINAEINTRSVFERKNYFYPDLPKGYQTTQLDEPIVGAGEIEINLSNDHSKLVRIHHAHLEEDAGKSLHGDSELISTPGVSGIDLNRAGTPLIEIVSEPDMRSAEEAVAFAKKLHGIVTALGICDGEMSQGSMRFDVNISIRPQGDDKLGTRTETKNLNSFRFMEDAIEMEVARQINVLESGGTIKQETRLYNGETKVAKSMRSKEESNDYRYFPCPDLLPVVLEPGYVDNVRKQLPELPEQKRQRFIDTYELGEYDAEILSADSTTASYFENAVTAGADPKLSANWVMGEVAAKLNQSELTLKDCPINADRLAGLIQRISDDTISNKIAKQVFDAMWNEGGDADSVIEQRGLKQVSDTGALEVIIDEVISGNQQQVDNYRNAEGPKQNKMLGFFVGQIMKVTKGQANPKAVNELLLKKLQG